MSDDTATPVVAEEEALTIAGAEEEEAAAVFKKGVSEWTPKTELGVKVKNGELTDIDDILDAGITFEESEIVDFLLPDLVVEFVTIGQSKGKFGGGKRKTYRVTQKKTAEGTRVKFTSMCVVGSEHGYIGLGMGNSGETVPARTKSEKAAKLSVFKVDKGCGSWECSCNDPHSIPFAVKGKCGSVTVTLMPAPKGTGLAANDTCKQMLHIAGIKDIWCFTRGNTITRFNLAKATFNALKQLRVMRR